MTFLQKYEIFAGMTKMWAREIDILSKDVNHMTKENQAVQGSWRKAYPKYHYNTEKDHRRQDFWKNIEK